MASWSCDQEKDSLSPLLGLGIGCNPRRKLFALAAGSVFVGAPPLRQRPVLDGGREVVFSEVQRTSALWILGWSAHLLRRRPRGRLQFLLAGVLAAVPSPEGPDPLSFRSDVRARSSSGGEAPGGGRRGGRREQRGATVRSMPAVQCRGVAGWSALAMPLGASSQCACGFLTIQSKALRLILQWG